MKNKFRTLLLLIYICLILNLFLGVSYAEERLSELTLNLPERISVMKFWYRPLELATPEFVSIEKLKKELYCYKYDIRITSYLLRKLSNYNQLNLTKVSPVIINKKIDIRLHCEFFTDSELVGSFSLSNSQYMLVNNQVVKSNKVFYEFIIPVLPGNEVKAYQKIIKKLFGN